jgi:hypothetical protein
VKAIDVPPTMIGEIAPLEGQMRHLRRGFDEIPPPGGSPPWRRAPDLGAMEPRQEKAGRVDPDGDPASSIEVENA